MKKLFLLVFGISLIVICLYLTFFRTKSTNTLPEGNMYTQPDEIASEVESSLYYDEFDFKIYSDVRSLAAALELCAADNDRIYSAEPCSKIEKLRNNKYLGSFFTNSDINLLLDGKNNLYITYAVLNNTKITCQNKSDAPNYGDTRYAVHRSSTNETSVECLKDKPTF